MTKFIARGPNCWGMHPTNPRQAITNARKNCSINGRAGVPFYQVFKVSDETWVNGMGGFNHPLADETPTLFGVYDWQGRAPTQAEA